MKVQITEVDGGRTDLFINGRLMILSRCNCSSIQAIRRMVRDVTQVYTFTDNIVCIRHKEKYRTIFWDMEDGEFKLRGHVPKLKRWQLLADKIRGQYDYYSGTNGSKATCRNFGIGWSTLQTILKN